MDTRYIVIFDGVCNFCNGAVNFIIARDPEKRFAFVPVQSKLARELMSNHGIEQGSEAGVDTLVLIKEGRCYLRTDAVLEITRDLDGFWWLLNVFRILPRAFRDWFYRAFARRRYRLFGKRTQGRVLSPDEKDRFPGDGT
ncbi:thiol-disulfide oxidoreductase DCC family protein [Marinobacter salicampi]|uniref:thiol-disulfide oxidoreductase DCC family protein n=1 Tax=Marinobacter salicampi TaxID=435907 RepID=UPI001408BBDF|nr:DCC1-like thiol-disulfide oxidoreductase family protein [Marinobacter salicampi]